MATLLHYGVHPGDLARFLLAIILCTILPGLLFLSYFCIYENDSYKFILAPAIGICLDIVIYIFLSVFEWDFIIYPVFGLIFMLYISRRQLLVDVRLLTTALINLENRYFISLSLLSIFFLALVILFQFLPNPLPGADLSLIYYIDQTWHLGNIAEINNHWYPQDPRLAGYPFHYHIFIYIFVAFISKVSGITVPVLFFRLSTWFLLYLLFGTVYFTGSRWFNNRAVGILHIITFFFLGTLLLSYPFNIFLVNLFTSPTFLLASIFFLFLIIEIKAYIQHGYIGHLWLSLLLVLGLSGSKGNFFPIMFAGLLACWVFSLLSRKSLPRLTIVLVSTLLPFSLVFFYIFKGIGSEGINLVPFEVMRYTHIFTVFKGWFGKYNDNWFIWGMVPIYVIGLLSFRLLAFVDLIKKLIASIPNLQFDKAFMFGTIFASLIPGFLLSYRGRSEYFYLFVGLICFNLISAGYLHDVYNCHRSKLLKVLVTFLVLVSTADTILTVQQLPQIIPELKAVEYKPLTPSLYEALSFLRDNTESDALVASYRSFIYSEDNPRFFYYSAFSERRMLVEGWGYMSEPRQVEAQARYADMAILYSTRDENLAASILNRHSIDYIIVENQINQHLWFNTDQILKIRFENGDIEIYETLH